jgi:CheY-like chemotaxis protein
MGRHAAEFMDPRVPQNEAPRRAAVLVVDDEPALGTAIRRSLTSEYDVSVVVDPIVALARIRAGERFAVILCDLYMPQMNGVEFCAAVVEIAPELRDAVVFMSGDAPSASAAVLKAEWANAVIEKPFEIRALRELVRDRVGIGASATVPILRPKRLRPED